MNNRLTFELACLYNNSTMKLTTIHNNIYYGKAGMISHGYIHLEELLDEYEIKYYQLCLKKYSNITIKEKIFIINNIHYSNLNNNVINENNIHLYNSFFELDKMQYEIADYLRKESYMIEKINLFDLGIAIELETI